MEYQITPLGRSLAPLFAHLTDWAVHNLTDVERARARYDAAPPRSARH